MSDLISRSALIKEIEGMYLSISGIRSGKGILSKMMEAYKKNILHVINEQPTAYNPEKVVEDLEEYKNWYTSHGFNEDLNRGIIGATNHAIDIVKRGGVE